METDTRGTTDLFDSCCQFGRIVANLTEPWGSPKIVAELAKLGIGVAKSTVEKYRPLERKPPSPTWRAFLDQHVQNLVSLNFFVVPTVAFRGGDRRLARLALAERLCRTGNW